MALRFVKMSVVGTVLFASVGCCPPDTELLNAPPQGTTDSRNHLAEFYAYHNDQGMIADMSIADIHFVPHSATLSGTGEARLGRYAELLAGTGGTLTYDTKLKDDAMVQARLEAAREYLAVAYPSEQHVDVVVGLAGGRGMNVIESAGSLAVAKQAEPRGTAYNLSGTKKLAAGGK